MPAYFLYLKDLSFFCQIRAFLRHMHAEGRNLCSNRGFIQYGLGKIISTWKLQRANVCYRFMVFDALVKYWDRRNQIIIIILIYIIRNVACIFLDKLVYSPTNWINVFVGHCFIMYDRPRVESACMDIFKIEKSKNIGCRTDRKWKILIIGVFISYF